MPLASRKRRLRPGSKNTQRFVSRSECADRRVDVYELLDFAAVYGTTVDALLAPLTETEEELKKKLDVPLWQPTRGRPQDE